MHAVLHARLLILFSTCHSVLFHCEDGDTANQKVLEKMLGGLRCPPPLQGGVRSAWTFSRVQPDSSLKQSSTQAIYRLLVSSLKNKAADFSRSRTSLYSG